MRVIVVGAGVGGLVAGLRLAHAGAQVTILEQGERAGGKLNVWKPDVPGVGTFRFDTGPHVLTMPWAIRELFDDLGEPMEEYLTLERTDPICRYHFPGDDPFDAPARPEDALRAIATRFPGDESGFRELLRYARRVHDVTVEPFLRQDFGAAVRGIPTAAQWRQLAEFLGLRPWRTLHALSARHLSDPKLRQIFDLYAFYNGSSPYRASAIFSIIAWVQWGDGTYYLRGGLRTYADALLRLAEKRGVEIRTGTTVDAIRIESGGATGVTVAGTDLAADAVVCNVDPLTAYARLIGPAHRPAAFTPERMESVPPSTSAFVLLLGVRGTPAGDFPHLSHYNSFLPPNLDDELQAIFERGVPADDPVIGVTCQSVTDPTAAPPGHTNLFVMTSPPAIGSRFEWNEQTEAGYRDRVLALLETRGRMPGLRERIVCEQRWTPRTFADRYGAWRGSLYGASSNGIKSGFFRPPNRASGVRGLYFVGGGTHPGGGLPLVTLSGKIVAEALRADYAGKKYARFSQ
ncbi:MAG: phytoene desaturase family protein [Capsulimonadales bacterium]|nr:phytoene desaturase family protein [Capsulimonadales bacterium]